MVYEAGSTNVTAVMQSGPGLAFIAYPEALAQLPGAAIWTVLFFAMFLTIGLDTQVSTRHQASCNPIKASLCLRFFIKFFQFAIMETMTGSFIDQFPMTLGRHKTLFTLGAVVVEFLLGIIMVTRVSCVAK